MFKDHAIFRQSKQTVIKRLYIFTLIISLMAAMAAVHATTASKVMAADMVSVSCNRAIELAESVVAENKDSDMSDGGFEWAAGKSRGWLYHNGLMMDALMKINPMTQTDFRPYVEQFYNDNIYSDGTPVQYYRGELDSVAACNGIFELLTANCTGPNEEKYRAALQYTFHELMEVQKRYPDAGGNFIHKQKDDSGTPNDNWAAFPIGLDGAYMSKIFMYRCADAMENKDLLLKWEDGSDVSASEVRAIAREQLTWMCSEYNPDDALNSGMRDPETGLLYHGYDPGSNTVNGIFWTRGIGWVVMASAQVLDYEDDAHRGEIISAIIPVLDGMLTYADPETGLWRNLPDRSAAVAGCDNKLETSASAMFAYAYLKLAFQYPGYLGSRAETYRAAGLKAYDSIARLKVREENGRTTISDTYLSSSVCSYEAGYFANGYVDNSALGIAPFLMAVPYAMELSPAGAEPAGWVKEDGRYYYYESGETVVGWKKIDDLWYYFDPGTAAMKTGWLRDGSWYYLNNSGIMVTGWQQISGKWYYFDPASGAAKTGWLKNNGSWYFLDRSTCAMRTGWLSEGGKWYFLNGSGVMVTGWHKISGKWYFFDTPGIMHKGWLKDGGKWYYMQSDGTMACNVTLKIDERSYKFNRSGAWIG